MATTKVKTPTFTSTKTYETYKNELTAWRLITKVPKKEQGIALALELPEGSKIREKVFDEIDIPKLHEDGGYETYIEFLDKHLGKDDLADSLDKFEDFENYSKKMGQNITQYIEEFDQKYTRIQKKGMGMKSEILAFKLIGKAGLNRDEKMLVLTGVDFTKRDTLYEQAKASLKKFKGGYTDGLQSVNNPDTAAIKLEPQYLAEHEEALWTAGYMKRPYNGDQSRGVSQGRGQYGRGGAYHSRGNSFGQYGNFGYHSGSQYGRGGGFGQGGGGRYGGGDGSRQGRGSGGSGARPKTQRHVNPIGPDGEPIKCKACGSFRHLMAKCPDSYENMQDVKFVDAKDQTEEAVLFTGYDRRSVLQLGEEARNCAVLDSACTSTVCGEAWMQGYLESLSDEDKSKVEMLPGEKVFKFGGGEKLKSQGSYKIPAVLAGKDVTIATDVVSSGIPLLLSKGAMKKAEVKMNLKDDTAEIFGIDIALNLTTSGHYCVPIDRSSEVNEEYVCSVKLEDMNEADKFKTIRKLHRQFAHPNSKKLKTLMKDACVWQDEYDVILEKIHSECQICKQYAPTPAKPAVALPMAKEFNEKVSMDLKKWKQKWILHLIDMWSRLTVSCFIDRKKPSEVLEKIMLNWVGAGYGIMKSILSDNGGEFSADEIREAASILNVVVVTTAAESPFQNGLNERNHGITDFMLSKLEAEFPNTPDDVLLAWANTAKNSMQMHHGFSSYQLVFGKNPNLPNILYETPPALEGSTTSETLAKHLNALHQARLAFTESEAAERIRRALRCKMRAAEQRYVHGDLVYYKRNGYEHWLGPAKVVFQDGKVIFIRHGGVFVRVSPNRLIKAGEEFADENSTDSLKSDEDSVKSTSNSKKPDLPTVFEETAEDTEDDDDEIEIMERAEARDLQRGEQTARGAEGGNPKLARFRPGQKVKYKKTHTDDWVAGEILGRAGKASGKYPEWFNVRDENGEEKSVDFGTLAEWQHEEEHVEEVNIATIPRQKHGDMECMKAKHVELEKLRNFDTYEEVEDEGQFRISTTWVLSEKGNAIRARLVARGFEDMSVYRKDSPTVAKSSMRMIIAVSVSRGWQVKTTDIKSAFLQGKKMEREVFIKPPKEAGKQGCLWRLKHCLYGLNDAARHFYQSVVDELQNLGCEQSTMDPSVFYKRHNGLLIGVVACHIDDFLHAGSSEFDKTVMQNLCRRFLAGKNEAGNFQYVGFRVTQDATGVVMDQSEYLQDIEYPVINTIQASGKMDDNLSASDQTCLRQLVGRLNWLVQGSRPDIAYEMVELSTKLQRGKVKHLIRAMKCLRKLRDENASVKFSKLGPTHDWKMVLYTDAAHANLDSVHSVGGHVVFLADNQGHMCPIAWKANKIKRVVRSSLAAEALSLQEGLDNCRYMRRALEEMVGLQCHTLPIVAYVDNKGLVEAVYSTKMTREVGLRLDLAITKEFVHSKENITVQWCAGRDQLADSLTKRGASGHQLLQVLQTGLKSVA